MNDYWFEIVRRSRKRYDWVFVADRDGRPRVLARSGRDYRSRKKVRRAIARLQDAFPYAEIRSRDQFRLPNSRFEVVPGVLPLRVQSASAGFVSDGARERRYAGITAGSAQDQETQAEPATQQADPRTQQAELEQGPPEPPPSEAQTEPPKAASSGRRRR